MLKDEAYKNLVDFYGIMKELGIVFWLDGGTLLGAYRDKDFPVGDEDDVDLGTWDNYRHLKETIKAKCKEKGFDCVHEWDYQLAFKRNGNKIDFFFHRKKEIDSVHCLYKEDKCIPAVVPVYYFEELDLIDFCGLQFNRPRRIESYLKYKYGNWEVPIPAKEYRLSGGCYNPNVNKVLRPDYVIE